MKYPTKLSDAAHILIYIHLNPHSDLCSATIASSIQTHPSYVRQIMASLKKAGIIDARRGQATPVLCRDLSAISLLDVYRAVEGDKPLLHQDVHTNPECCVGMGIQCALKSCFDQVQKSAEEEMANISLQNVIDIYNESLK